MGTIEHVSVHYRRLRRQVSTPRWSVQGRVGRSHFGGGGLGGRSLSRLPRCSGPRRHAPYNRSDQVEPGFRFSGRQPEPGGWLARLTHSISSNGGTEWKAARESAGAPLLRQLSSSASFIRRRARATLADGATPGNQSDAGSEPAHACSFRPPSALSHCQHRT